MKKLLLFLIISSSLILSQSYSELISKANLSYKEKDYSKSGKLFDLSFEKKQGSATDYYNAACSWSLAGNSEKAINYLLLSAQNGYHNLSWIKKDSDLNALHKNQKWSGILDLIAQNKKDYEKDFNIPLKEKLESIMVRDQMLRQLWESAEEKFGGDSEEMKYFWQLMSQEDHKNEKDVIEIINKYGWVGKSVVGGKANMSLWLVIQHAPLELQEKYLPLLKQSVLDKESQGNHLALLEDRVLMRNKKPQIYGSQIITKNGKNILYDLFEPEFVNQRREEVGLAPIEDYLKRFGIIFNTPQKQK